MFEVPGCEPKDLGFRGWVDKPACSTVLLITLCPGACRQELRTRLCPCSLTLTTCPAGVRVTTQHLQDMPALPVQAAHVAAVPLHGLWLVHRAWLPC